MTAYAASLLEYDYIAGTVIDGNQLLASDVLTEATLPPPPGATPPAPWGAVAWTWPCSLLIWSRRYRNGTCLEAAQKNSSNQTTCEKKRARKRKLAQKQLERECRDTVLVHVVVGSDFFEVVTKSQK